MEPFLPFQVETHYNADNKGRVAFLVCTYYVRIYMQHIYLQYSVDCDPQRYKPNTISHENIIAETLQPDVPT